VILSLEKEWSKMETVKQKPTRSETLVKLQRLPEILAAAEILFEAKIINVEPAACIRLYMKKNPDINEMLVKANLK
jgi:hypothetical protein